MRLPESDAELVLHTEKRPIETDLLVTSVPAAISRFVDAGGKVDQYSPHVIGTAGNEIWLNGEWSATLQAETGEPIPIKGYWSEILVRDGDAWKAQMLAWNTTPAPPA